MHNRGVPKRLPPFRAAGRAGALGMEFAAAVVVCLLAGWWADGKLGTSPWLTLAGVILGSIVGFWSIYRMAKNLERESEDGPEV